MARINERIKERRLSLNLTLAQIAEALGVKEATAQRYESGDIKNIKHDTIVALANILKCSPTYLMGWDEEKEIKQKEPSDTEKKLLFFLSKLNDLGQLEALKRVEELSYITKYTVDYKSYLEPVAAHIDKVPEEEELYKIKKDLDKL